MIEAAIEKGYPVSFDLIGLSFSHDIKPGPRGPQMRSSRFSFFKEITPDEMKLYTPDQITTILKQRDNLHHVLAQQQNIAEQSKRPYYMPSSGAGTSPPPGFGYPENKKPWVPDDDEECQFKCCHTCRPTCESRSYLSLDGIGSGDILPSAAVGFGFHLQGSRPVLNADIVKSIGYRPVPLPRSFAVQSITPPSSPSSIWSILDIIDEQIVELARLDTDADAYAPDSCLGSAEAHETIIGNHFDVATHLKSTIIRPPWTPPTTPSAWNGVHKDQDGVVNFENCPMICNGRSSDSLKTNPRLRRAAFESIRGQTASHAANYPPRSLPNMNHDFPWEPADGHDVGLFLPFNGTVYSRACFTPLPMPTSEEDAFFNDKPTPMMEEEMEEGHFHGYPLHVADGIAMMEESVGLGVPDVMMQA